MTKSAAPHLMVALSTDERLGRIMVPLASWLRFLNEINYDLECFEDLAYDRKWIRSRTPDAACPTDLAAVPRCWCASD